MAPMLTPAPVVVSTHGLTKAFGGHPVLHGVDLTLHAGEVAALLGANGAGKSTLVNILCGSLGADAGELWVGGVAQRFTSPMDARRAGVVTVHQHADDALIPGFTVAQNLLLDELCDPAGPVGWVPRARQARAAEIASGLGLTLALDTPVDRLGSAQRQLIVLARALALNPRLLILDEPTASLSATEAQRLFALVDALRARGVAILFISHRLSDIQRIADRALVLRDGRLVASFTAPLDLPAAVSAMLGEALAPVVRTPASCGALVLRASGCKVSPQAPPFDLSLHEGEVVALVGLLGAGKTEIAELLFGLRPIVAGYLELDGRRWVPGTPRHAIRSGVFMAGEDRARDSLIPGFSLAHTLTLPFLARFSRFGFIRAEEENAAVAAQVAALGIRCEGADVPMNSLSGGNQQKVVLARWMLGEGRVLILDEPFQGVDIRARRDIGERLRTGAARRAVLVICADPDEALEVADRIVVIREGAVAGEYPASATARAELLEALAQPLAQSRRQLPAQPTLAQGGIRA